MMNKVHYFLKTFKGREWSGPAWYSHEKDENGFPTNVTLEYWYPLDLGTHGSTDWDGEDLIKIFPKLRKEFPQIGKEWVQGNIHSHHNMGAFFSGTDKDQLIDGANKNFYYSLVVSTKKDEELAFAVSYPDQFNQIHILEIDDFEIEEEIIKNKVWEKEAKWIKKNAPSPNSYVGKWFNKMKDPNTAQTALWNDIKSEPEKESYEDHIDFMSFNGYPKEAIPTEEEYEKFDNLQVEYMQGRIKRKNFIKECLKIGVDEYGSKIPT